MQISFESPENYATGILQVKIEISPEDQERLNQMPLKFEIRDYNSGVWNIPETFKVWGPKTAIDSHHYKGSISNGIWIGDFVLNPNTGKDVEKIKRIIESDLSSSVKEILRRAP